MTTTASTSSPASSGQTWALRCATGLDVRDIGLSYDEASNLLDRIDTADDAMAVIDTLVERGAKGTPKLPKAARERAHNNLFVEAWKRGVEAATAHTPTPMIVQERANPLDDTSPVIREYAPVRDGVCGFASVIVRPGNSSFARWLVATGKGRKHYRGGINIWISDYNQSYERKTAHANAMAAYLREHDIKAYADSRLD